VKSSSSFVRREKAGRTGYSWSVIMIAEEGNELDNSNTSRALTHLKVALHHPCCTHARCNCSLVRSGAGPEEFSLRLSW